eukprot:TRINITY_DN4791_c0_g3_i1.p1 TRINITY_DN4791_c0_g3~~TRINITY_DN4791_c0_g3_i1.p1  ORF type:complete len:583 (-),score=98.36 TRINITY_DN4791_c0_g3_i1:127-1875(-)
MEGTGSPLPSPVQAQPRRSPVPSLSLRSFSPFNRKRNETVSTSTPSLDLSEDTPSSPRGSKTPRGDGSKSDSGATSPRNESGSKTARELHRPKKSPRSTPDINKSVETSTTVVADNDKGKERAPSGPVAPATATTNKSNAQPPRRKHTHKREKSDSHSRHAQKEMRVNALIREATGEDVRDPTVSSPPGVPKQRRGSVVVDSLNLEEDVTGQKERERNQKRRTRKELNKSRSQEGAPPAATSVSPAKKEEPVHHYFVLRLEEARNLKAGVLGRADPYCTFDIIPSGIIGARTSGVRRGNNPQWREQFVGNRYFGLDGQPKPDSCTITVMHNSTLSADTLLGKVTIPFTHSYDHWFPLQGERAQGELRVILRFYTSDEGKRLYRIFREANDIDTLCKQWEQEVLASQDSYLELEGSRPRLSTVGSAAEIGLVDQSDSMAAKAKGEEKEGEEKQPAVAESEGESDQPAGRGGQGSNSLTPVRIPVWDVPMFSAVNKVWTPLQMAVSKDNVDLVKHLQKLGCNMNARDQTGNTVLHVAARKQLQGMIKLLIRFGVDQRVQNYLGGKDYKEMLAMFGDEDIDSLLS